MTNSAKMTVEEKLVQHLKNVGLGQLIEDEDALTELTREALKQALWQPIRMPKQYGGGWDEKDSLIITEARALGKIILSKMIEDEMKALLDKPEVREKMIQAILMQVPDILRNAAYSSFNQIAQQSFASGVDALQNAGKLPR